MEDDDIENHKKEMAGHEFCDHSQQNQVNHIIDVGDSTIYPLCDNSLGKKSNKRVGRWLLSEHYLFIHAILKYGTDWKKVKRYVKTRSVVQIRSHSQKYLIRLEKRKNDPMLYEEYRCKF